MIFRIGSDIVDTRRINKIIMKYGEKFKKRCFSENEIKRSENKVNFINSYAKRYAAKEACAKALGTGIANGIFWKDIEITNNISGKPNLILHNNALNKFNLLSKKKCLMELTISDEKNYSIANVVIFEK